jgi:hypothetical protein
MTSMCQPKNVIDGISQGRVAACAPAHPAEKVAKRVVVEFTASAEFSDKLERAKEVLSHKYPNGKLEHILSDALEVLLEKKDPERILARAAERLQNKAKDEISNKVEDRRDEKTNENHSQRDANKTRLAARSPIKIRNRYLPTSIRSVVWRRDGGQCSFVLPSGKRCGERKFLEYDHIKPFALNGEHSAANVRLLCRSHNCYSESLSLRSFPENFQNRIEKRVSKKFSPLFVRL